jgi:hypothetical protein
MHGTIQAQSECWEVKSFWQHHHSDSLPVESTLIENDFNGSISPFILFYQLASQGMFQHS